MPLLEIYGMLVAPTRRSVLVATELLLVDNRFDVEATSPPLALR